MEFKTLIKLALEHYNIKNKNVLMCYDNNIVKNFGTFDDATNVWKWGWANINISSTDNEINKIILNYGLDIDYNESEIMLKIKSFIVNSSSFFYDNITFEIYLAIISYLLKDKIKYIIIKTGNSSIKEYNFLT